jgi:hypothetical protein
MTYFGWLAVPKDGREVVIINEYEMYSFHGEAKQIPSRIKKRENILHT